MQLQVKNINKSFGDKQVLKNINFTVTSGEAFGYLGRNGAGKTTSIRILTDIFRADSGEISLDGAPINRSKVRIGYLPEERGLYPKSKVGEQMIYIAELRGMTRAAAKKSAQALLEKLGAIEYWDKKLETLSKGNQQKIQLAIAILHDPDIVILDEPFSGLDPVNAAMLRRLVSEQVEQGKIVMFSSHEMSYVEQFCEHICIINKGEVVLDGRIKDIKRSYPRNRIGILPEGDTQELLDSMLRLGDVLRNVVSSDNIDITLSKSMNPVGIIAAHRIKGEEIELTLRDAADKSKLLQLLAEYPIDSIRVLEPSLEEIFVEKAGM